MAEGSSASSDFYDSSVRRVTALAQIRTDALSAQLAAVTQELEAARLTTRSANAEKAKESLKCRGLEEQLAAERRATAKAVKEAESCRAATAIARDAVDKSGEQLRKVSNQLAATQAVHVAQEEAREHKIRAEVVLREFTALSDELESRRV
eukprot:CAMPEP_0175982970 /NCGR_PEP_ID=MMETSP0108-20121206/48198_1 /TAXON_ID=195067 ORGANISM="Goniomonas pacifica, Strain CCMP1869" /NCGR_SAMPLE_ID=MMETSP0108 /ASSEMBLY_ACC=CAM_ASM_000204 /LENGTH=150 /DNA_ID=CAMNT_0017313693 /DNA_START=156 /DNA_END=604 /DNA_ORIENTATION=-